MQVQESLDGAISPCSDLWTWSCGGWLKKNPLPSDKSIWNPKEQLAALGKYKMKKKIIDFFFFYTFPLF